MAAQFLVALVLVLVGGGLLLYVLAGVVMWFVDRARGIR